ncbi:HAMP domain-containing histidine kinase [Haloterrigena sp. SYSU A121-1]|uniref:histidine kinase n=1 Tax=Haloterrigena gelatinilytica TaxID=2741724 RepID=A0A8J8GI11_9EURY|nr:HAMP domain-containing sensor histidine kinase [Haloterrigena gelatinilytica]NUB89791.1 HAMP domain-containing histidine kinase [Haloterrigena gelatinilytica]
MQRLEEDDWVADVGKQLPVSPLSILGFVLAATIGVRIAGETLSTRTILESIFPLVIATAVVLADRFLVAQDVSARDRLTVFAYSLGGFLAAFIVAALHLYIAYLDGLGSRSPLYLLLMSGTMGVGAGTVAGIYDIKQRAATREARRQSERLEEFASVVSHDLRNPLSVARGRLDAAFQTGNADHLKEVDAALTRMDELIEESLSVARSGTQVEETYEVPLEELAGDAWSSTATDEATYEVVDHRTLQVDPLRAKQLFENLFRNSIEHGRADVTIRVGACSGGFFVEDDGHGIPEDERDKILEQGYSTAEDGSGLGLAIVRAIADAHGWSVAVTESERGGARFEFTR